MLSWPLAANWAPLIALIGQLGHLSWLSRLVGRAGSPVCADMERTPFRSGRPKGKRHISLAAFGRHSRAH